jgi:hypothetical protein
MYYKVKSVNGLRKAYDEERRMNFTCGILEDFCGPQSGLSGWLNRESEEERFQEPWSGWHSGSV